MVYVIMLIGISAVQPDMMSLMMTYNPISISLFTASWTVGMASMMFPTIVPMVLLYNKLIMNKQIDLSTIVTERKISYF
jgi:predicted metal-binding membrane protein